MFRSSGEIVVALWCDERSSLPLQSRPISAWFYLSATAAPPTYSGGLRVRISRVGRGGRSAIRPASRARVEALGDTLSISSQPVAGTSLLARILFEASSPTRPVAPCRSYARLIASTCYCMGVQSQVSSIGAEVADGRMRTAHRPV